MTKKNSYHHGDLRQSLLAAARNLIANEGIDSLTLRKLAEQVGVSRTALYHHFADKSALLCALAEEGFEMLQRLYSDLEDSVQWQQPAGFEEFLKRYIVFACEHREHYELMFGRTIWQQDNASPSLQNLSRECFRRHVEQITRWQQCGVLSKEEDSLRLAQTTWGTLHGLARLILDGIYSTDTPLDEICACAANSFLVKQTS